MTHSNLEEMPASKLQVKGWKHLKREKKKKLRKNDLRLIGGT